MLKMKQLFPRSIARNQKQMKPLPTTKPPMLHTPSYLSNNDSTIQSSFNHDELIKQMEKKKHTLRNRKFIQSGNQKKLRQNNTALMNTLDQHISVFQTIILHTIKDLAHQLVISTTQNTTNQTQAITPFTNIY